MWLFQDPYQLAVFSKKCRHFFSRSRMDTRVGAFESPMSQLSQDFFVMVVALLENFLQGLKMRGNLFFWQLGGRQNDEISQFLASKMDQKLQKNFLFKNVQKSYLVCSFCFPDVSEMHKTHFSHRHYH